VEPLSAKSDHTRRIV